MTTTRIVTLDAEIGDEARLDVIDEQLLINARDIAVRLSAATTSRVARELASTTPSVVAELARVQEENRRLRAELDRAHRLLPTAGLATVTDIAKGA